MRSIRKYVTVAGLAAGLALAGAAGTSGMATAEPAPAAAQAQVQSQFWHPAKVQSLVYSSYGGPTTIGSTQGEDIYLYCQADGAWGWWSYAWVPSVGDYGWLRNGDFTDYTNPIFGLDYC